MTSTASNEKVESGTQATDPKASRRRRRVRFAIALVVVVLLYTLGGFFGVPWLVKGPILSRVNERLNASATIEKVSCNPFTLRLVVRGVRVVDAGGAEIAKVGEVDANASLWRTIWRPGYQAQWVIARDVWAKARVDEHGHVSVEDVLKPMPAPKPGEASKPLRRWPRLVVEQCRVERVTLELGHVLTGSTSYEATLKDINVKADGLDLGPTVASTVLITGSTARDEAFNVELALKADPLTLQVDAKAENLALDALSPYGIEYAGLNVRVVQGRADAELFLDFKPDEAAPRAMAELKRLTARNVRVEYFEGAYAGMMSSDLPRLDVENAEVDAIARKLSVDRVALTGASAFVRRNEAGQIDVETVMRVTKEAGEEIAALAAGELIPALPKGPAAASATGAFEIPAKALTHEYPIERITRGVTKVAQSARGEWDVRANKVEVDGATAAWQDTGSPAPVAVAVTGIKVTAGPVMSQKRFEIPLSVDASVGGGTVKVEGTVRPLDLEVDAKIAAEGIDGAAAAGYLPRNLGAGLDGATLSKALASADGTLRGKMALKDGGESELHGLWEGRAGFGEVALMQGEARAVGAQRVLTTGTLRVDGPISALDVAWEGSASAEALAIDAAIAGSEAGSVRARVDRADVTGTARASVRADGMGLVTDISAEASGINAEAPGIRDLHATVGRAEVRDVALDLGQKKARVEAIVLDSPSVSTRVAVLPAKKSGDAPAAQPSEYIGIPVPSFSVEVGEVALRGASGRVEDPNTTPAMVMSADRVEATLTGVATREGAPIKVALAGMVQESGRVSISGSVDLFRAMPSGDVKIEVASMPLMGFDAATGRYLGYEVDRGRATVDMPLELKNGELSGSVKINLDRFYLGDEVESDEALNVPVQLGLSLLRDSNEQIDATVGVKGRIDEPGFTVAGLVWKAISNLIVKAATAPFEIIGSLFGSEEDLSRVAFEPGTDRLGAASLARLDTLGRAMRDRPGITLTVVAQASPKGDTAVLKREGLRAWILDAVRKRDPRVVTLTDDLYRAQLNDAFMVQATGLTPEERQGTAFEQREEFMLGRVEIAPKQLADLANARAQRVVDVLVNEGRVPAERVKVTQATEESDTADEPEARLEIGK